ncbi:unnamed protein product [Heterobilharzia americana]|nr:unnamed protein product [Heterobilharzia americana]
MMKKNRCVCGYCPHGALACDQNFMRRYQRPGGDGYGLQNMGMGVGQNAHNAYHGYPMTSQYPPAYPPQPTVYPQPGMPPQQPAAYSQPGMLPQTITSFSATRKSTAWADTISSLIK